MNAETVDARAELRKPVEAGLTCPPVIALQPVVAQVTEVAEANALRPVVHCLRIRPARPAQPLPQLVEVGFGDIYAKRDDLRTHRNTSPHMQQLIPGRQGTGLDNMQMVRPGAGRAATALEPGGIPVS